MGNLDAIDFVRTTDAIAQAPIALWSDSMCGRIALVVAALHDRVDAVVCQVPAMGRAIGVDDPHGQQLEAARQFLSRGRLRRPEGDWVTSAVVSPDQSANPSLLTPLTAFRWFIEYGGRYGSGWDNRAVLTAPAEPVFDPYGAAPHVRAATLFVMSPDDEMPGAASDVARAVFDRLDVDKELVEVDGGHFGVVEYPSQAFDGASDVEAAWLAKVLDRPG